MQIPVNFTPREYQFKALSALEQGTRQAVLCWSRRGGKTLTVFAYAARKMVESPMNVVMVYPTKEQGRTSFWDNIDNDGMRIIDRIPDFLLSRKDNNNMKMTLKNGSTFQVLGTTDPDVLRGANGKLYIFDEFVDTNSAALDIIEPIVAVNKGQVIIISTPKIDGISGATFKRLFEAALNDPKQYASRITAREYLSDEELEQIRQRVIDKYGNDFIFRQEYLADWGQVSSSSYYGSALQLAQKRGYIGEFPHNPKQLVFTAWDLGISDSTAITFFQYYNKQLYLIDYFETNDIGNEPIVKFVQSKPYNYGWHFFPHDGSVRDSDAVSRIHKIRQLGLVNSSLLTREPVDDGINRVVEGLSHARFHAPMTSEMRRKLLIYKRKFNAITGDYLGPDHKTESHCSDSVRYCFASVEKMFDPLSGEFLFSSDNGSSTSYESDFSSEYQFGQLGDYGELLA